MSDCSEKHEVSKNDGDRPRVCTEQTIENFREIVNAAQTTI